MVVFVDNSVCIKLQLLFEVCSNVCRLVRFPEIILDGLDALFPKFEYIHPVSGDEDFGPRFWCSKVYGCVCL